MGKRELLSLLLATALHQGCGGLPKNEPLALTYGPYYGQTNRVAMALAAMGPELPRTAANIDPASFGGGPVPPPFVGIALSGGGSRAANFSTAVLLRLDELGLLKHVSAISSVSGGSLPAAYFGLFGTDRDKWNEANLRRVMGIDFEAAFLRHALSPVTLARYWLSADYGRTDILAEVFDELLFEGRAFKDLQHRVLINATEDNRLALPFTFSDQRFWSLASRLDTFPVARGVAASAAFPGVFTSTSLRNYSLSDRHARERPFIHLYDGGVRDNLGIETLADLYTNLARDDVDNGRPVRPCFIFQVNAQIQGNPHSDWDAEEKPERRGGFVLDLNFMRATDYLFAVAQARFAAKFGLGFAAQNALGLFDVATGKEAGRCAVWHISIQRLRGLMGERSDVERDDAWFEGWPAIDQIPTRFALVGPGGLSARRVQDLLFDGARELVLGDPERPALYACRWFLDAGLQSEPCTAIRAGAKVLPAKAEGYALSRQFYEADVMDLLIDGPERIHVRAPGWYALGPPSYEVDEDGAHALDTATGSSIRVQEVTLDLNARSRTGITAPFSFVRGADDDERGAILLRELVERYVVRGVPRGGQELPIVHMVRAAGREREDARAYPVLAHPPRADAVQIQKMSIGGRTCYTTELPTVLAAAEATPLRTGIYITAPRETVNGSNRWQFLLSTYSTPAGLSEVEVARVRAVLASMLVVVPRGR